MASRPPDSRTSNQAGQAEGLLRAFDRQKRFGNLPAKNLRDSFLERAALRRAENHPAVLDQGERRAGTRQRVESHAMHNMRRFGLIRLEKLTPRGHGVEEMRDLDARAHRTAAVAD